MRVSAIFFDGEHARDHAVEVWVENGAILFEGPGVNRQSWKLSGVHSIDPPAEGQPFRITHMDRPGARLVLKDQAFVANLLADAPHLRDGHYAPAHLKQVALWTVAGIAALLAVGYIFLTTLPNLVAKALPQEWRDKVGQQIEKSVVGDARQCDAKEGVAAFKKMIANLTPPGQTLPEVTVRVYDIDILNAFAVSGGRLIFTREIVEKAETPDEIAGVLAHEIGHVASLHPEEQLVRVVGLQVLLSAISGGSGADLVTNTAGIAALLRYSRDAEREADAYARDVLTAASIDTTGLKTFFKKIMKLDTLSDLGKEKSALDRIGNILSTHPDTNERIDAIKPLPAGVKAKSSLTEQDWQALKKICG